MADPAIGEVAASVFEKKFGKKPTDNIFSSRALFFMLGKDGFKEKAGGGRLYEDSVEYAENTTHQMQGEMDTIDTTRIQVFDAVRFNIKIAAGSVVYSDLEELRAAGGEEKFELIGSKLENGKKSQEALLNRQCWGSGGGSNDIDGLQKLISITPTTGTVGGINRANFSFWRNQVFDATSDGSGATTASNIQAHFNSMWLECVRGTDKPDLIITGSAYYNFFKASLQTIQRITDPNMGKLGFQNLMYETAPVVYEDSTGIPAQRAYFLNTDYLHFRYAPKRLFKPLESVRSINQDASVQFITFAGNLTCSNASLQGVYKE